MLAWHMELGVETRLDRHLKTTFEVLPVLKPRGGAGSSQQLLSAPSQANVRAETPPWDVADTGVPTAGHV